MTLKVASLDNRRVFHICTSLQNKTIYPPILIKKIGEKIMGKLIGDIEIMKRQHFKLINDFKKLNNEVYKLEIKKLKLFIDIKYLKKELKKLKQEKKYE